MKSIAFALDPDGYWVEIIGQNPVENTENIKTTDTGSYRMVIPPKTPSTDHRLTTLAYRTTP